ncbi:hypothetical protein [Halomonas sp. M20]|uniref:hypothetical protein n=1 Tax=Halomonas sp. M20 TaxID=2763264 RepID=UPI001D0B2F84|nr:hypothetical protein [Halomonas sp. M20]
MNEIFNNNFLFGFLLAKDRPRDEALNAGLQLGQMPANSPIGMVLVKRQVDQKQELETRLNVSSAEVIRLTAENLELKKRLDELEPSEPSDDDDANLEAFREEVLSGVKQLMDAFKVPDNVANANKASVEEAVKQLGDGILQLVGSDGVRGTKQRRRGRSR